MTFRIDWPHLLGDFVYLAVTGRSLARRLGMTMDMLDRIERGALPTSVFAERAVALWCDLTSKPRRFVPMTTDEYLAKAVPGLTSDAEYRPGLWAPQ